MSKIAKAADEILEKMSFDDYKKPKKVAEVSRTLASDSQASGVRRHVKKNKLTLYLTEEEEALFNEIYIKRLKNNKKTDRSTLFAEAVQLLYKTEVAGHS